MVKKPFSELSRREREVLDILFRLKRATANDVMGEMEDPPTNSSVRSILKLLQDKELVRREQDGARHVFSPAIRRDRAQRKALAHVLETFFDDSPEQVVTALLDVSKSKLRADEVERIRALLDRAKKEGR